MTAIIEGPDCGGEPAIYFNAIDITESGEVGGTFTCFLSPQAATWDAVNGLIPLPFLAGFNDARVHGLNSINEVVGSQFSSTLDWRAVIWQNGVPSRLPDWPGTTLSFAPPGSLGVSEEGSLSWPASRWRQRRSCCIGCLALFHDCRPGFLARDDGASFDRPVRRTAGADATGRPYAQRECSQYDGHGESS
ncbi:MAG: hypothetical protein IIB54_14710 [Planctomycetes bacterium]|nr:hypothetical protein [Planctomycetota bacterium]